MSEWRASSAESSTLDECAPSLSESRIEYSLSDLPRPWLRSYSSNVMCDCPRQNQSIRQYVFFQRKGGKGEGRGTYTIVKLGDPPVHDGQAGEEDEVDERVDVALFREVQRERTLLVVPRPLEVADKLADGAYDLVFIDGDKTQYEQYAFQAVRLLRPGGLLALDNMLWHDKVADPAVRDETTVAVRDLGKRLRDDERLQIALLPVGDGLLTAIRR